MLEMLTPKQVRIFGAFLAKPFGELTYRQIKEFSEEKSNSVIQNAISRFAEEELITRKRVGNVILLAAELENPDTMSYFGILANERLPKIARLCLRTIRREIHQLSFASVVVFGSYAKGEEKKDSDLDIAVFVATEEDKKNCRLALNSAELKCVIPLDAHVFTKSEMLEMLKDKDENLGKQIARKHLAVHNPSAFYSIIREGMEHGFRVVYQTGRERTEARGHHIHDKR